MQAGAAPAPPAPAAVCWDAVLLSPDLFSALWKWISDRGSKHSLRAVNQAMRMQVDGAVAELTCPADADPEEFRQALEVRWPGVKHLIMHVSDNSSGLSNVAVATASSSLRRLEKLTVRQVGVHHAPRRLNLTHAPLRSSERSCAHALMRHAMRPCAKHPS
jgi:hypothetical protein